MLDYFNEIECMLYIVLYYQTNFDVFIKHFELQLRYFPIFLSLMINFFDMFVRT